MPDFAPDWALFLDVDGTLLDIAPSPAAVKVDADLIEMLRSLSVKLGGAAALVSGRALDDVDRLFAPLRFCVAGQHGAERRDFSGTLHRLEPPGEAFRIATEKLKRMAAANPGLVLEDKGYSVAVHFRRVPHLEALASEELARRAGELGAGFKIQPGKKVLELKPIGWNKGTAIEAFMREPPFRGRRPVFAGDDLTDEHGFAVVNRLGGHSIKVGPEPSAASWRLRDPKGLRRWLGRLGDAGLATRGTRA